MRYILFFAFLIIYSHISAKEWKDGKETYTIVWDEWGPGVLESSCIVIIKGDSITVLHDGNKGMTGEKGDVLDKGKIMKHKMSGEWIIGQSPDDVNAEEVGGCTGGPTVIEFKNKIFHGC